MPSSEDWLDFEGCSELLSRRLAEPAPGRIQLLAGPRQVGKTTLLLSLAERHGASAIYAAADAPEAALPGFWDRIWIHTEEIARRDGRAIVLLDEIHVLADWAARLKGEWDRLRRRKTPVHIVATGSSSLRLAVGSRESLAGRFERITLGHWTANSLAKSFQISPLEAAEILVESGCYPGAFALRADATRWSAYVRDAILEPAIGRDILALAAVRKPALLRQVLGVCTASPAQIVSLQKIQGQLQDAGALETVAHYLALLEEAFLVAAVSKYSGRAARQRASPPKLVTLNNALLAIVDPRGPPSRESDPQRFGAWLENACLARAWNAGQRVRYWREEPLEVDAILDGDWGSWALQVSVGPLSSSDLKGLAEFTRRHPSYRPLLVCDDAALVSGERSGFAARHWRDFIISGPAGHTLPGP
jgi:uncharacterized protein